MARAVRRDDTRFQVIGFKVGHEITSDVEDRFIPIPRMIDNVTGKIGLAFYSVEERGMMPFDLPEVIAMGFTTDEYIAMLRFETASSFQDHIRSEEELNALMISQIAWKQRPRDEELTRAVLDVRAAEEQRWCAEAHEENGVQFRR